MSLFLAATRVMCARIFIVDKSEENYNEMGERLVDWGCLMEIEF
jgi:hypothetical protein